MSPDVTLTGWAELPGRTVAHYFEGTRFALCGHATLLTDDSRRWTIENTDQTTELNRCKRCAERFRLRQQIDEVRP